MSRSYYYLVASLPLLDFDAKPPFSYETFLDDCRRLLSDDDVKLIEKARLNYCGEPLRQNALFDKWLVFANGLRNELAWFRAHQMNKDPLEHMRGDRNVEPAIVDVMMEASKAPDPLTAEKAVDRAKWQRLDELLQGHYFDIEFLVVYSLKLQILERYQRVRSPRGKEIFQKYKDMAYSRLEEQGITK